MKGNLYLKAIFAMCVFANPQVYANGLSNLWDDPLMTNPKELMTGPSRPDNSVINCPENFDFKNFLLLNEAINIALCNNPEIHAAWSEIKNQAGVLGEARSAYLPTINGSITKLRNTDNYSTGMQMTSIGNQFYATLSWRLFDFGGRKANNEEANQMLLSALAGHDASLQKVMLTVIQSYFDSVTSQSILMAKHQITELAQQTLNVAKRREQNGVSPKSDTLQASTALAKAQLEELQAQGDYQKKNSLLKQAMAIDLSTEIHIPPQEERIVSYDLKDLDMWIKQAERIHPAIKQARARWLADENKITVIHSEGLPTIDITAHFSKNGFPNQGLSEINQTSRDIGLMVSVPIFDGFSNKYKEMEAHAQAEISKDKLQMAKEQVLVDVIKSYTDAQTSLIMLKASEQLLKTAEEEVTSAKRRYDNNVADILEVLNAQTSLADAKQRRIKNITDWQSARLSLLANTGVLSHISDN